ncbi:MAG: DUF3179 domain-containing (seleno)protein [Candidatus Uhrbacteria bacterium]
MRRSTIGIAILLGLVASVILYGFHWFYRVPPEDTTDANRGFDASDLVSGGTPDGGIPSIDTPIFESVAEADQYLKDDGMGLDVELDGRHRFYPFQIVVWHEIVNDTFGDKNLAVTFSPLTMTGMVFERPDVTTVFHVAGSLWSDNLILVDAATKSLWSQILGRAVVGERSGTVLVPYQTTVVSWTDWKVENPRGEVLSRDTAASRDYTRDPYGNYAASPSILFPLTTVDARLPAKTMVYVVTDGDARTAYPADAVAKVKDVQALIASSDSVVQGFWFVFAAAYPGITLYQLP